MFIKFNTNGQVRPRLDTIQKACSWILMLNCWAVSSNKILDWSIVLWILISGLTLWYVVYNEFSFDSLDFHSQRGLRYTIGADSISCHVQLLASCNKISSFEIQHWLVLNSIFVFIHHSLSPFGTDIYYISLVKASFENWALDPKYIVTNFITRAWNYRVCIGCLISLLSFLDIDM
jgi:hypothetical protein